MQKAVLNGLMFGFLFVMATLGLAGSKMTTAERAAIVIGEKAPWVENHAAQELAKYIQMICGSKIEVLTDDAIPKGYKYLVLIGTPDDNTIIKDLEARKALMLEGIYKTGNDGFIIKSLSSQGRTYLVFSGKNGRSILYAVYHYLENFVGCGFFEDGEYIPKRKTIPFGGIDVIEEARFRDRMALQYCAIAYTMAFWDFNEWRKELDWLVKRKFNLFQITYGGIPGWLGGEVVWRNTMKRFGVDLGPPTEWEIYQSRLCKQIINYAKKLGLEVETPTWFGSVPQEFRDSLSRAQIL